jgi:hypothetical protein
LYIPVTIKSEAGYAEPVLSTAKLNSVERDEANAERLACACEAFVPVHHGWRVEFFEEEPSGERRRFEN